MRESLSLPIVSTLFAKLVKKKSLHGLIVNAAGGETLVAVAVALVIDAGGGSTAVAPKVEEK
ncbi:hypothetical protein DEO72_LG6g1658 [Vigna unguiculata]|uniref:Uncharacterized protein n=1 Tax=Vigna unguiculata TaxID=3917 RepID=A0A4D6M8W5_VIGUN|nr:hypothetical protein DEO72_LG6g1658 [Vigna unguiculata]